MTFKVKSNEPPIKIGKFDISVILLLNKSNVYSIYNGQCSSDVSLQLLAKKLPNMVLGEFFRDVIKLPIIEKLP